MSPLATCGFVGLGNQGAPIAERMIAAGASVALYARRAATLERFLHSGAIFAPSLAELGHHARHVGVCVLDDAGVLDVCEQLLAHMHAGSTLAIHSTTLPETCRDVAKLGASYSVNVIDAPVSGGAPAASAGKLTVMVGGPVEVLRTATPVFNTFAERIIHLGDVGAGQTAKLINNALLAANLSLADATLSAGVELGLERRAFGDLLRASSGRSFALEVLVRQEGLRTFSNHGALLEKVRLLGEIIGDASPAIQAIRHAAFARARND